MLQLVVKEIGKLNSVELGFSGVSRDYDANIVAGRKIVTHYNDYLWLQMESITPQRIILSAGFYTGTELAAELKTQLDANTAFSDASITFTVSYTSPSFTITPSSGTMRYIDSFDSQPGVIRKSIAACVIWFKYDIFFWSDSCKRYSSCRFRQFGIRAY